LDLKTDRNISSMSLPHRGQAPTNQNQSSKDPNLV